MLRVIFCSNIWVVGSDMQDWVEKLSKVLTLLLWWVGRFIGIGFMFMKKKRIRFWFKIYFMFFFIVLGIIDFFFIKTKFINYVKKKKLLKNYLKHEAFQVFPNSK
jgi:type III secretory pathway component EscU